MDRRAPMQDCARRSIRNRSSLMRLGAKIPALERRLNVNSALFLANYKDLQRTAFDSSPAVNAYRTTNAGKARVKGIETELTYVPARWLTLAVNYAYTDAKYLEYNVPQDN